MLSVVAGFIVELVGGRFLLLVCHWANFYASYTVPTRCSYVLLVILWSWCVCICVIVCFSPDKRQPGPIICGSVHLKLGTVAYMH